ncbi:hypothetical protein ACTMSW_07920 [Micromonospora sp. BQ11]|uniref:hypothetical protein n=1 Tax=Micromonospora sp. BQ11 TaxID=3452212 RepID=UPI003F895B40
MTAESTVIDDPATGDPPHWRTRWSRREDDRRQRAYEEAASAWQRHHDHLTRLRIEAVEFRGYRPSGAGLPVPLADHEVVHRLVPGVRLVEVPARHAVGLPAPGVTTGVRRIPARPGAPRGLRIVDHGIVLVTDRRVTFAGSGGAREWRYADVTGLAHHTDAPLSLLHSTGGTRLAGLLASPDAVVNFRFYLTLAFAAATGRRAEVVADVDASLVAHEATRPVPPPPARPADAPLTARRPDRRTSALAALVVVAAAWTTGVLGTASTDPPYRAEAGTSAPFATDPPAPADAVSPAPVASSAGPTPPRTPSTTARADETGRRPPTTAPPVRPTAAPHAAPPTAKDQTWRRPPSARPAPTGDRTPAPAPPAATVAPSETAPEPSGSALPTACPIPCVRL